MKQGSYMLITPGMTVQGTDTQLGTVANVVADIGVDIFRGIVLAQGLLFATERFIPGEHVVAVYDNIVEIDLSKSDVEHLKTLTDLSQ